MLVGIYKNNQKIFYETTPTASRIPLNVNDIPPEVIYSAGEEFELGIEFGSSNGERGFV